MSSKHDGRRFGRLVVLSVTTRPKGYRYAECKCDCGTVKHIQISNLTANLVSSCGCIRREMRIANNRTHGMGHTRAYKAWSLMKRRCERSACQRYPRYGGRGIRVCPEWRKSFVEFWKHVQALLPAGAADIPKGLSLERVDVNGHYEPSNVVLATAKEQARNTTRARLVTHDGATKCVAEWAEELGVDPKILGGRLNAGWTFEAAVSEPVRHRSIR
jgi:hypothetical protein